ncbi:MAG TPA: hypothetical protein VMX17_08150 [Candidatus Glassbacteria bacterium]|nr:hypothetical protein [Candidatus Glassbacteria bacterium]
MGIRAHRVKTIEYADQTLFKLGQSKLGDFIMNHDDTSESDGGGQIETQLHVLKEALDSADELGLDDFEVETLKTEIKALEDEGKKDDYIIYHLF